MCFRICIFLILLWIPASAVLGQAQVLESSLAEKILNTYRPRIAVSAEGHLAIAWEALYMLDESEEWRIDYQLFHSGAKSRMPARSLAPPAPCNRGISEQALQHIELRYGLNEEVVALVVYQERGEDLWGRQGYQQAYQARIAGSDGALQTWAGMGSCAPFQQEASQPRFTTLSDGRLALAYYAALTEQHSDVLAASPWVMPELTVADGLRPVPEWSDVVANDTHLARTWIACSETIEDQCALQAQVGAYAAASPIRMPPLFRVDEAEAGGRVSRPAIAMNQHGTGVVTWVDYRSGRQGAVYAQQFDRHGAKGPNILVSQDANSINWEESIRPEVAILDEGRFMVVWTDSTQEGYRALGRSYDANGIPLGNAYVLDPENSGPTLHPDIATDGFTFAVAWLGEFNERRAVHFRKMAAVEEPLYRVPEQKEPRPISFFTAPNPFSARTTVQFKLAEPEHVTLALFDVLGRLQTRHLDRVMEEGTHRIDIDATHLPAGVYVARLTSKGKTYSRLLMHTP